MSSVDTCRTWQGGEPYQEFLVAWKKGFAGTCEAMTSKYIQCEWAMRRRWSLQEWRRQRTRNYFRDAMKHISENEKVSFANNSSFDMDIMQRSVWFEEKAWSDDGYFYVEIAGNRELKTCRKIHSFTYSPTVTAEEEKENGPAFIHKIRVVGFVEHTRTRTPSGRKEIIVLGRKEDGSLGSCPAPEDWTNGLNPDNQEEDDACYITPEGMVEERVE